MGRGPCWGEGLVGERALFERGPCWGEGLVGESFLLGRASCWGEGLVGERALLGRGPCWREGLVGESVLLGRGPCSSFCFPVVVVKLDIRRCMAVIDMFSSAFLRSFFGQSCHLSRGFPVFLQPARFFIFLAF